MSAREIAGRRPRLIRFEAAGDSRLWCSCGRSANQPFCDGSHKDTGFTPIRIVARSAGEEALLCLCKRTKSPPYCDGSHNAIGAYEGEEGDSAIDWRGALEAARAERSPGRADLDGGCHVLTAREMQWKEMGGWRVVSAISKAEGAGNLSLQLLEPLAEGPDAVGFGSSETALFIVSGDAVIEIGDRRFGATTHAAVFVKPGERFRAKSASASRLVIAATVCPPAAPQFLHDVGSFDDRSPSRVSAPDDAERRAMGERYYQVLTSPDAGGTEITLFIGAIPKSRAAPHRHLYEEALIILSGAGVMWTENRKCNVSAGDIIYLPRKQLHSLECVSAEGMVLAGAFYPAGSPAINY
ncbi:MAG: CDGSH iron-sulfur domain-containing protein [Parvularculaceae bacterium]|nr:CDGSH iron-sulfur domain-containing protein [Parvularculaceae bacterium]